MSDILGLHGANFNSGTEELIAVWKHAPMIYNSGTGGWNKAPIHLTIDTKAEFEQFVDNTFLVNGVDSNYSYTGTGWHNSSDSGGNVFGSPIAKYIKKYNTKLYLANIKIAGVSYPSRVWLSDLPQADNTITWGLETGTDLSQTAASGVITSSSSLFDTKNIKVGDPFTITTGTNAGEYIVQSIDSETQITLSSSLTNTTTDSSFWVGGNFFDVQTDDGDEISGLDINSGNLLIPKKNSVHTFNSHNNNSDQIKDIFGTTARRSIVSLKQYTYHFYPNVGIIRVGGTSGIIISNAVIDAIEGVTSANYSEVVGWVERKRFVNFYLGDITLRDATSITDCIITYDTLTSTWGMRSYDEAITVATEWLESDAPNTYVGNDSDQVFQVDTGNDLNDVAMPFELTTHPVFPGGRDALVTFDRLRVWVDNGLDVQAYYKLYYKPTSNQKNWTIDTDFQPLKGSMRAGMAEFVFNKQPPRKAAGIALKFIESSSDEPFLLERVTIYYSNVSNL